jgi:hypothetical protein
MNEHQLLEAVAGAAEELLRDLDNQQVVGEAIRVLRHRLEILREWQEYANEADQPRYIRSKPCKQCEALFFFAVVDGDDDVDFGKPTWLPLEVDPVNAGDLPPELRWVVDFSSYPPKIRPDPNAQMVYIDHRMTCGTKDGPKKGYGPAYARRWKVNQTRLNAEMENESIRSANDLRALQRRLHGDDKQT